jgi:O-antigen/teichoic acid export membrane protein
MAYFMLAGYTVIAAVGNSLAPRLSRHWVVSPLLYRRLAARIGSVAFAIGCLNTLGALLFGKKILTSVYRAEYAGHNSVFVILMAATAFYYCGSILGFAVTAARRLWSYAIAYSSVPLICLIMAQLLVPKFGLDGAALAVLVASGLGALAPVLVISRALGKRRSDDLYAAG